MELKNKIEIILKENGLKTQSKLCEILGLNYTIFNRNVNEDRLTGDMIKAFADNDNIVCDLNWLAREKELLKTAEPNEEYGINNEDKLNKAIQLIMEVKADVSRK